MRKLLVFVYLTVVCPVLSFSQDYYPAGLRASWMEKAKKSTPQLQTKLVHPVGTVKLVQDVQAFQGWKALPLGSMDKVYTKSFREQTGVVADFGDHLTGYCTLTIKENNSTIDGPLRLKLTFGEIPSELATPFEPYTGTLSRAWLQDEIITVMTLPATITIPRRMAFRYLKIDLLASSPNFDFNITDLTFSAETSVTRNAQKLQSGADPMIKKIDSVGLNTLKECMQTVYEDGPKRDRRLWIGDTYLESLANTYSFKNDSLTKRCLYLLAGLSTQDGFLSSNAFENPVPHAQQGAPFLFDYSLLYTAALKEYYNATKDRETTMDLWPVAKRQMDNIATHIDKNGLFDIAKAEKEHWWLFVDWRDGLDRQASLQGIMIFTMKETLALARELGKEKEVADLPGLISKMVHAARSQLYSRQSGLYLSGTQKQVSYASQAWMVISGVASQAEGQKAMKAVAGNKTAVKPGTPYLYHYYIQALITCGLKQEAKRALVNYWGGMVSKGADTFWEVYDPENEKLSPYNFFPVNSYCHAWSCTPVYFIRKYPEIFQ